jgi:DNA-binding HxlR family transcriptional regulator
VGTSSKESFFARVSVVCKWGPGTNYPGEERKMVVMLELERGAWRIADIRSLPSKFSKENTLVRSLKSLRAEAEAVSANCGKQKAK